MNWYLERIQLDEAIKQYMIKKGKYVGEAKEKFENLIIQHKREYRERLKRENAAKYLYYGKDGNGYGEIVNGGGEFDWRWQKVFFSGERWTDEEKMEFVDDNWIECKPSQYDCTGQIFTSRIEVFNVPAGVVAYIIECMDV